MITDSLASLVDKVIGKTGQLRSPAWWMHRIFSKVGEELAELKDKVAALIPKVGANSDYIDTITPLIDSYFSQPIEFEATHKGTVEYKYGNLYGKGDWVNKQTANTTAETTEKLKFYGNINFSADDSSYNTTLISLALPNGTLFVQPKKMFYGRVRLATLVLPECVKLGKDASEMFYGCSALTTLDVSGFDTSKVTNMDSMFRGCSSLTALDVSGFDTSKVTDMNYMFRGCSSLTALDVSGFDTSKVTNMGYMFYNCSKLTALDVNGFDTSKVTNMGYMFYYCYALTTVTGTITGIKVSLDLSYSPLTNASAMVFINGLAEVTTAKTITFKATTYTTLTEEQIAVATSKGWTVAST